METSSQKTSDKKWFMTLHKKDETICKLFTIIADKEQTELPLVAGAPN